MGKNLSLWRKHMQIDVTRRIFDYNRFIEISTKAKKLYEGKEGIIIPKFYSDSFDWSRWRLGISIWRELGVASRYDDIVSQADILRYYAIGYLPGKNLICKPKENETAVMFLVDDEFCWTHLIQKEFNYVFIK
jgi:hypothetical protein